MKYGLLGPLEVIADDQPLRIGSARQRIVLSALLLQANRAVPLEQLIAALWDDTPPVTAKSQVQTCISALRRLLSAASGSEAIETRAAGYMIRVRDGELDVAEFDRLVREARAAAGDGRPGEAVTGLRAALALWRGPALADVESQLVQATATRLNENRLMVLEDWIDLNLGLSRHRELIGELSQLVRQYPLRERLRAQHMLALYRSARQAEALESFRDIRKILAEELGIDPGAELCELERAILASDPALGQDARPAEPWAAQPVVPRQLPAATADLTGREDVLASLGDALSASPGTGRARTSVPVAVLSGKGGVGKTAIALHAAHRLRQDYPGGQLFVQLQDPDGQAVSAEEVLARFLRALDGTATAPPAGLAERTAAYRSAIGERRVLIVLDDATCEAQIAPLIPGHPGCAVIITSRYALPGLHGADHFEIGDLDERASIDLLARVIGTERIRAEPAEAVMLVRLCGRLPLALRIVAAKLAVRTHWSIGQMVRRMTDDQDRLDELMLGSTGIRHTLSLSYDSLAEPSRRLFRRLGLLGAADFSSWVTQPLLDGAARTAEDALDALVEANLVEVRRCENGQSRLRLHDLVRIFALERLAAEEPVAERMLALRRLLGCWLSLTTMAHQRIYGDDYAVLHGTGEKWHLPGDVSDRLLASPLDWLRAEQVLLVSAVLQAGQAGLDELCWDLAMSAVTLFESEYQVELWRKTHEVALTLTRKVGNRRGEAAILYSLGNLTVVERLGEAAHYLDPALAIFEELQDTHGRALTLVALAFVDRLGGRTEQALARYSAALAGLREVGDRVVEVDALSNIAQIYMDREQFGLAEEYLGAALVICRSLRASRVKAQTEYRLGELLLRKGDYACAERSFRAVLQLTRDEGDLTGEAYALIGLGKVHTQRARYAEAGTDLSAALSLARAVGDNIVHGRALLAATELHLAKQELQQATLLMEEALELSVELGAAAVWRARMLALKARVDERAGRQAAAAAARHSALELADHMDPVLADALMRRPPFTG